MRSPAVSCRYTGRNANFALVRRILRRVKTNGPKECVQIFADALIEAGDLLDQAFGTQPGEVMAERRQRVLRFSHAKKLQSRAIQVSDVGETHQGMHDGELPWVVELEAGDSSSAGENSWLSQFPQLQRRSPFQPTSPKGSAAAAKLIRPGS